MSKSKGPKFGDNWDDAEKFEVKQYEVHRQGLERPSSVTLYIYCPFCKDEVKAYLWSLSGGGKRCACGALFTGRSGRAVHFRERSK